MQRCVQIERGVTCNVGTARVSVSGAVGEVSRDRIKAAARGVWLGIGHAFRHITSFTSGASRYRCRKRLIAAADEIICRNACVDTRAAGPGGSLTCNFVV
ncbi:unnamed protein product, partial [Iphiclides podalirius]